jgi:hypothetical protein
VLTQVSQSTKLFLNRLGVFTVSSFHAYICARSPSLLNNLLAGRGATKRRPPSAANAVAQAPTGTAAAAGSRRNTATMNGSAAATVSPSEADKVYKVVMPGNHVSAERRKIQTRKRNALLCDHSKVEQHF